MNKNKSTCVLVPWIGADDQRHILFGLFVWIDILWVKNFSRPCDLDPVTSDDPHQGQGVSEIHFVDHLFLCPGIK